MEKQISGLEQAKQGLTGALESLAEAKRVKEFMQTPLYKEVIEEKYLKRYSLGMVKGLGRHNKEMREELMEEFQARSFFAETMRTWSNTEQIEQKIANLKHAIENHEKTKTQSNT